MTNDKIKKYDIAAEFVIIKTCNFRCPYCIVPLKFRKSKVKKCRNYNEIIKAFDRTGLKWWVEMSGGEPFLTPDFAKLCQGLTKKHLIGISTNLSSNSIYEFCGKVDPEKVEYINCSLHISERERLGLVDDFIEKFLFLRKKGVNAYVTQILWPPVIKRYDEIFNYFQKRGINVRPNQNFIGTYKGKYYPPSYSVEEKQRIKSFVTRIEKIDKESESKGIQFWFDIDKKSAAKHFSFKGLFCLAGKEFVRISQEGNVTRCADDSRDLGNIFKGNVKLLDKAKKCTSKVCNCVFYGFTYAKGEPKETSYQSSSLSIILNKYVYPITTPLLKPIRRILK